MAARRSAYKSLRRSSTARSLPRAPLATRGFYGPSFRSPAELKVIDTAQATYELSTTPTITLLNGVAQGTEFNTRIGRKITMKSIQIRGYAAIVDSPASGSLNRVMLIYDTQPNGALPAASDVLNANTATSMLNLNNRDRFKVLMDKQFALGFYSAGNIASNASFNLKKFKKLNHDVIFSGSTNLIGVMTSGVIFLLTVGTGVTGTATNKLVASFRIRFSDK